VLDGAGIHADQHDTQIDVSRDPMRIIMDRRRPFYVGGTTIEVSIPFTGDAAALKVQPTTFMSNLPRRIIREGELALQVTGTNLNSGQVKTSIASMLLTFSRPTVRSAHRS